ncbi:MAG: hypothetical protein KC776_29835 [Myxococcales bacterium]|nr:hypothetical protein [Myxococcales bacterium]
MSRAGLVAFAVVTLTTCAASAERKTSPKSVKLFDVRTATHEGVLRFSTLSYRATDQARYEGGYEAAFLYAMTSRSGPFHLTGLSGPALRFLDEKSFSLSLPQNTAFAGIAAGPVELEGGFGVSLLSVDVVHGHWSAQLLSPRAAAGVGVRLGPLRVGAELYTEYLWRWFGPDYFVRGIGVSLRWRRSPPLPPFAAGQR